MLHGKAQKLYACVAAGSRPRAAGTGRHRAAPHARRIEHAGVLPTTAGTCWQTQPGHEQDAYEDPASIARGSNIFGQATRHKQAMMTGAVLQAWWQ